MLTIVPKEPFLQVAADLQCTDSNSFAQLGRRFQLDPQSARLLYHFWQLQNAETVLDLTNTLLSKAQGQEELAMEAWYCLHQAQWPWQEQVNAVEAYVKMTELVDKLFWAAVKNEQCVTRWREAFQALPGASTFNVAQWKGLCQRKTFVLVPTSY